MEKIHIFLIGRHVRGAGMQKKRSEPMVTYQLTLYKKFFCQKMNVDPKDVETHFALLKRTAKKNHVEFFRVTSGPRKTENALKLFEHGVVQY